MQYMDRVEYWNSRTQSRLRAPLPSGFLRVTLIIDGMDKSKFRYPRSRIIGSKEFDALLRPSLDLTATIVHGWFLHCALSEPYVPKDSSWSADMVLHALDRLAHAGVDLRKVSLHVQADNTAREVKNNTLLRLVGALVASHRIHDGTASCLLAGHSHEDVDAFFSCLTAHLEANPELHTPEDFRQCIDDYIRRPDVRPHELEKEAVIVEAVRDWTLDRLRCFLRSFAKESVSRFGMPL